MIKLKKCFKLFSKEKQKRQISAAKFGHVESNESCEVPSVSFTCTLQLSLCDTCVSVQTDRLQVELCYHAKQEPVQRTLPCRATKDLYWKTFQTPVCCGFSEPQQSSSQRSVCRRSSLSRAAGSGQSCSSLGHFGELTGIKKSLVAHSG